MSLYQIQLRRDTTINWGANNPILAQGELGIETDTNKIKIGDGTTAWSSLSYFSGASQATLQISGGGTGQTDAQSAIDAITQVATATNEYVLTKDTASGHAVYKAPQGGYLSESGSLDYLTDTTHKFAVGANSLVGSEKFLVKGSADIIQAIIKAHSTQTSNILEIRKSDDTILFAITNTAGATIGGTSAQIADTNGLPLLKFTATASAVNEATIASGATGNNWTLTASGETNTGLTLTGKGTKGVTFGNAIDENVVTVSDGAGAVIDSSLGNIFVWTASADRTAGTTINAVRGRKMLLSFIASGGARTLTLPTSTTGDFAYGSDITILTQTASGKGDLIGCVYGIPVANRWNVAGYSKGY